MSAEQTLLGDAPMTETVALATGTVGPFTNSGMVADIPLPEGVKPSAPKAEVKDEGFEALAHAPMADPVMPYGPEVQLELERATLSGGAPPEEAAQIAKQWTSVFFAHGIAANDTAGLIAAGAALAGGGLDEATTETAWVNDAYDALGREYGGAENADRALARARQYVQAHPALNDFLTSTRLGNHPRVVLAISKVANRAWQAGKLKLRG